MLQQLYKTQISATLRDAGLATGHESATPDWRYIVCVPENAKKVRVNMINNFFLDATDSRAGI